MHYKKSRSNCKPLPGLCKRLLKQRKNGNRFQIQVLELSLSTIMGEFQSSPLNSIKNLRLDFPKFHGEDPTCWVYKTNQFFSYHNTPEHQKVMMASYHLEEETLIWFQDAEQTCGFSFWKVFVKALQTRFGVAAYDDPMEALTRLKQTSTVIAYKGNFKILSNRILGFFETHKLSCFLSGLKDEIRLPVRMLVPKTLNEVDFGSTHNFLDAAVLPMLHLHLDTSQILEVRVADAQFLRQWEAVMGSISICKDIGLYWTLMSYIWGVVR